MVIATPFLEGNVSEVALVARLESISSSTKLDPGHCLQNTLVVTPWQHLVSRFMSLVLGELTSNVVSRQISVGTKRGIFW